MRTIKRREESGLDAQAAMEYLMTYGWSILIIAVVLAAMFGLGLFNFGASTPNGCIADVGYLCNGIVFNTNTMNAYTFPTITAQVGSATSLTNVYFVVVPKNVRLVNTSQAQFNAGGGQDQASFWYWGSVCGNYNAITSITPPQIVPVTIYIQPACPPLNTQTVGIGAKFNGAIWALYSTPYGSNAVVRVATFTAISVRS